MDFTKFWRGRVPENVDRFTKIGMCGEDTNFFELSTDGCSKGGLGQARYVDGMRVHLGDRDDMMCYSKQNRTKDDGDCCKQEKRHNDKAEAA